MITVENLLIHELIGLSTEISASSNSQIVGKYGKIIDETKSMLILNTGNELKMIPKKFNTWKFFVEEKEISVNGSLLEKRPFDRLVSKI